MRRVATCLMACAIMVLAASSATARLLPPKADKLSAAYTYEMYLSDHAKAPATNPDEFAKRKARFDSNLAEILAHNANPSRSYSMGVNRFTDWLPEEYQAIRGARMEPTYKSKAGIQRDFKSVGSPIAATLDWRAAQPPVLTAVKDQGMCGDCWAHAVTETIESAYARATGQLLVLSQQQITSCTPREGSCYACDGMYPRYAYDYAANAGNILEEWLYPFDSWNGANIQCKNVSESYPIKNWANVFGFVQVAPNNQEQVVRALNELGPLSILVNAMPWMHYESGVFTGCSYSAPNATFALDHAVQLVGYGHDDTLNMDYWIVRNSWSAAWGEHGYIRLQKSSVPECGLNYGGMSCFSGANNTVATPSCGMCGVLSDAQFAVIEA